MPFSLDVRTLIIAGMIIVFYMFIILLIYGFSQKTYPGYRYWLASQLIYIFVYGFFGLRGVLPDFFSIMLANTLVALAGVLRLEGIKRFVGQEKFWLPNLAIPISVFVVFLYFSGENDSALARNTFISLLGVLLSLRVAWVLWRYRMPNSTILSGFLAGTLTFYALVLTTRAIFWIVFPEQRDILANNLPNTIYTTLSLVFELSWPTLFVLINGQRMNEENKSLTRQLEQLAAMDVLTDIYNRRKFIELSQQELARARRYGRNLSLVMFDLDRFKDINDTFGHAAGDDVLKRVACACKQNLRETDILGRFGGDEFVILLPESDEQTAMQTAMRLEEKVLEIGFPWKHQVRVGLSYGIATLQPEDEYIDALMARADAMLYQMKARRHNRSPILR